MPAASDAFPIALGGVLARIDSIRVRRMLKTVNARLTGRPTPLPFDETLPQSVSASCCGHIIPARPGDSSMPSLAASTASARNTLRRFRRNRRGSAAIEFALVAPVFFALLFAIIETAIMFFATQVLETMTQDSARAILTGQAQSGGVSICQAGGVSAPCTQATFTNYVCSQIPALFTCAGLYVDVESYSSFSSVVINLSLI